MRESYGGTSTAIDRDCVSTTTDNSVESYYWYILSLMAHQSSITKKTHQGKREKDQKMYRRSYVVGKKKCNGSQMPHPCPWTKQRMGTNGSTDTDYEGSLPRLHSGEVWALCRLKHKSGIIFGMFYPKSCYPVAGVPHKRFVQHPLWCEYVPVKHTSFSREGMSLSPQLALSELAVEMNRDSRFQQNGLLHIKSTRSAVVDSSFQLIYGGTALLHVSSHNPEQDKIRGEVSNCIPPPFSSYGLERTKYSWFSWIFMQQ